jgi:hypothetical protein
MKKACLLVCLFALSGCGFKVGLINEPRVSGSFGAPANVTVYREGSIMGFPVPMTFLIDGREIYGLWGGEEYSFQLDPGEYVFGYFLGLNECRRWGLIEPGRTYRIRLAPVCVIESELVGGGQDIIGNYTIDLASDEFDFGSARLTPDMKHALDDLARRVRASAGLEQLTIIGHTDSVGSSEYNYGLGLRRAEASKRYLVSVGGLDPANIRTASAGASEPVASNDTAEGRAKNRRIEIRAELYQG